MRSIEIGGKLRSTWNRIQFCPPRWAVLLNPFYVIRRGLYVEVSRAARYAHGRVMDFGAGSSPYRHLFERTEYVAVDIESSGHPAERKIADVYYDGKSLPFPDGSFDFIFSSEVLEHVFNLDQILGELNRTLKPGGRILLTTPFVWNEHEQPYDFARYTSFALRSLLERHGFEVERLEKTTGFLETVFQMMVVYLAQRKLFTRLPYLKLVACPTLFAPILLVGMALGSLCPKDDTFYHNNVVVAKKR